jgi:hypothetical protein
VCTPRNRRTRPRRRDALRTVAKLYLRGKTTLRLAGETDYESVKNAIEYGSPAAVEVTLTTGEKMTVANDAVKSVVDTTTRERRVKIDSGIFFGRKIEFRSLQAYNRDQQRLSEERGPGVGITIPGIADEDQCVAVMGEDLGEALLVVVNLCTEKVVWTNPAGNPANTERLLQATLLLAEVETLEQADAQAEANALVDEARDLEPGLQNPGFQNPA